MPYKAGRSCYLEGLLAERHTVFECVVFGMKDWQSWMALHKRKGSNLRFPGKDPKGEGKTQLKWLEKGKDSGCLRKGIRGRFCIIFRLFTMEFAKQTSFLSSQSIQLSLYISKIFWGRWIIFKKLQKVVSYESGLA